MKIKCKCVIYQDIFIDCNEEVFERIKEFTDKPFGDVTASFEDYNKAAEILENRVNSIFNNENAKLKEIIGAYFNNGIPLYEI